MEERHHIKSMKKSKSKKQFEVTQMVKEINSKFTLPDRVAIYCGDFRDSGILTKIPDGSVSLIILDPPYAEEYWHFYKLCPISL